MQTGRKDNIGRKVQRSVRHEVIHAAQQTFPIHSSLSFLLLRRFNTDLAARLPYLHPLVLSREGQSQVSVFRTPGWLRPPPAASLSRSRHSKTVAQRRHSAMVWPSVTEFYLLDSSINKPASFLLIFTRGCSDHVYEIR